MSTPWIRAIVAVLLVMALGGRSSADDVFYRTPVGQLTITEGAFPAEREEEGGRNWSMFPWLRPYIVLDGQGEAYTLTNDELEATNNRPWDTEWSRTRWVVVARAPQGAAVTGSLFVPKPDWSGMVGVGFTIPPSAAAPEAQRAFLTAKDLHYTRLQLSGRPGTAWFRRQAGEARRALGGGDEPATERRRPWEGATAGDTYELFTGGRAVSENLQLSRDLPPATSDEEPEKPVAVKDIQGITVAAMDWAGMLGTEKPALDPLAASIPEDQHALFLPSFEALRRLAATSAESLPIFRSVQDRSEDGLVLERYQRQLGLELDGLARLIGPGVVQSAAVTGSDPYFPTGTDVAVLFQTGGADALRTLLLAQIRMRAGAAPGVKPVSGEVEGVAYEGVISEDRAVCSYAAAIGGNVVVTNSLVQLRRLGEVQRGAVPAIAGLDEYKFFRKRYPVGADEETGFVFLSDATIRRWCGPEWRIGASRRLRAAAVLADLTAAHLGELATGVTAERAIETEASMPTIGSLTIGPAGVRSSVYGSPRFLTPISELGVAEVTRREASSYQRWRETYQRNWNWAFDPIGATFSIRDDRVSADLTVMPLIVGSQYRTWIDAARGASIKAGAGDPHDAIAQMAVAININSRMMREGAGFAAMMAPGIEIDPLGWIGECVSLYADDGPFWREMVAAGDARFFSENLFRAPIGMHVEVGNAVKLTAFLAAARGFIEQSAPDMTAWENRTHNGQAYVRVGMSEKAKADMLDNPMQEAAVYYAPTARALLLSLDEEVLKRAIDRQKGAAGKPDDAAQPWLGSSMCLRFDSTGVGALSAMNGRPNAGQRRAWSNLTILNEWKRLRPDLDPASFHEAIWGVRLVGGEPGYRWNERFKTMESEAYGHPGEPKAGPDKLDTLGAVGSGDFGLTFEEHGLRARGVVKRAKGR